MSEGGVKDQGTNGFLSRFRGRTDKGGQQEASRIHHEAALTEQTNPFTKIDGIYASLLGSPELSDEDKSIIERMKSLVQNQRRDLAQTKEDLLSPPKPAETIPITILRNVTKDPKNIKPMRELSDIGSELLFPSASLKEAILRHLGSLKEGENLEDINFIPDDPEDKKKAIERDATVSAVAFTRKVILPTNIPNCRVGVTFVPIDNRINLLLSPALVDTILAQDG